MRSSWLGAVLVLLSLGLASSVRSQSDDPIQALKDSISPDEQSSILQGVLGKGNGTGKKTDSKLSTPETVQSKTNQGQDRLNERKEKTRDGRILRQLNEDPELRPDDTILIELTPLYEICGRNLPTNGQNSNNGPNSNNGGPSSPNSLSALSGANGIPNLNGVAGVNGINGINNNAANGGTYDLSRCPSRTEKANEDKEKTDEEKKASEVFRKRILSSNPYKLNQFGVLELPGLPAVPMAGLTALEA